MPTVSLDTPSEQTQFTLLLPFSTSLPLVSTSDRSVRQPQQWSLRPRPPGLPATLSTPSTPRVASWHTRGAATWPCQTRQASAGQSTETAGSTLVQVWCSLVWLLARINTALRFGIPSLLFERGFLEICGSSYAEHAQALVLALWWAILKTRKERVAFRALRWFDGVILVMFVSLARLVVGFKAQKFPTELWPAVDSISSFQLWCYSIVTLLVEAIII